MCRQLGTQVLTFCKMRRWRNEILALVKMRFQAARVATVAGAARTTATMATTTAATMTPNGNKHNNQILSRHQW